jgi:hypothetical protein
MADLDLPPDTEAPDPETPEQPERDENTADMFGAPVAKPVVGPVAAPPSDPDAA